MLTDRFQPTSSKEHNCILISMYPLIICSRLAKTCLLHFFFSFFFLMSKTIGPSFHRTSNIIGEEQAHQPVNMMENKTIACSWSISIMRLSKNLVNATSVSASTTSPGLMFQAPTTFIMQNLAPHTSFKLPPPPISDLKVLLYISKHRIFYCQAKGLYLLIYILDD